MSFQRKAKIRVKLLVIGKTAFSWIQEGILMYSNRINHYTGFQMEVVADIRRPGNMPKARLMELESDAFLKRIDEHDEVILLDDKGKSLDSVGFSGLLDQRLQHSDRTIVFVVGGAFGFGEKIKERANAVLSLSKMTFSHQIIRVIFLEQLYRAFTIIKGEPYHH